MELIYSFMEQYMPFAWLEYQFMKNAFLAVLLVTPLFGLLGTMVVSNKMAFFSDSLGHGAFTGIAIGVMLGGIEPILALVIFSIIFAVLITYIKNTSSSSPDTIIGVFSSTAIAIGLMIMSYGGGFNKFSGYLIGDLLSITADEVIALAVVFVITVVLWMVIFNQLLIVSVNSALAASRGMKTMLSEMFFAALLAVVVAVSIQWVGLLIINSMLVLPAAASRNVTNNVRQYHFVSIGLAVVSGLGGLILSYYMNTAAGATIVLISAVLFFMTFVLKRYMVH